MLWFASPTRSSNPTASRCGHPRHPDRGVELANRIAARIGEFEGRPVPAGALDVTMYRDDLRATGTRARAHRIPGDIDGKVVVLVDDVLFSGRTIRAALDALKASVAPGRPARRPVDRGHREFRSGPTSSARTCRPHSEKVKVQ